MSNTFHIRSEDVSSGEAFDGTVTLPYTISGSYELKSLTLSAEGSISMWTIAPTLCLDIGDYVFPVNPKYSMDVGMANLDYLTDPEEVAQAMCDAINAGMTGLIFGPTSIYHRVATYNLNTSGVLTLVFDHPVDIKWTRATSTLNSFVGRPPYTSATDELNVTSTVLDYSGWKEPEYIEMMIDECTNQICTSHGTTPTLIIDVTGNDMTGQSIFIAEPTRILSFGMYTKDSEYPIKISKSWTMTFR